MIVSWRDEPPRIEIGVRWPQFPVHHNDLTFPDYGGYSIGFLETVPQLLADDAADFVKSRFAFLPLDQKLCHSIRQELNDWMRHRVQTGILERDFYGRWRYLVGLKRPLR